VRLIPSGSVSTYGTVAALAGSPRSARAVGQIAHFGDQTEPWHRVVNSKGRLAQTYPGGIERQAAQLEAEAVKVDGNYVDMKKYVWRT